MTWMVLVLIESVSVLSTGDSANSTPTHPAVRSNESRAELEATLVATLVATVEVPS